MATTELPFHPRGPVTMRMHPARLLSLILAASASVASKPSAHGITVTVVQAIDALPEPLRPLGAPGDVLITDGRFAALVGGSSRSSSGRTELTMEGDGWIAIGVTGQTSLLPTIQQRAASGRAEDAPMPYAHTNAIFIDVDGDGRVTAPWKGPITIRDARGRD